MLSFVRFMKQRTEIRLASLRLGGGFRGGDRIVRVSPKLRQFCDGVRFAAQMADVSYSELVSCLSELSHPDQIDKSKDFAVKRFLYSWSIIDSAYRLYGLMKNFPI